MGKIQEESIVSKSLKNEESKLHQPEGSNQNPGDLQQENLGQDRKELDTENKASETILDPVEISPDEAKQNEEEQPLEDGSNSKAEPEKEKKAKSNKKKKPKKERQMISFRYGHPLNPTNHLGLAINLRKLEGSRRRK